MKELASIARNFMLSENDADMTPMVELVMIVSEPVWKKAKDNHVERERVYETIRVAMCRSSVRRMMVDLVEIDTHLESMEILAAALPRTDPAPKP